ncbi:MAG TPA: hypothetical protein VFF81_06435 [Noviherbaspirillum sp.]|nr:hypothetical protein [Noviherbaspirillum sp.]
MDSNKINNENIFCIDWAAEERKKMLRSMHPPKPVAHGWLGPGIFSKGICGQDVSILNRCSVKAQLAGRGDLRAAWWNLYSAVYGRIFRRSTLEDAMYSFHKHHQSLTLCILQAKSDFRTIFLAIRAGGATEGMRCAIELLKERKSPSAPGDPSQS